MTADVAAVPDAVIKAVADAVTPNELGSTDTASSELVHRVMAVTWHAAAELLAAGTATAWGVRNPRGEVFTTTSEFQSREVVRRFPELWTPVCHTVTNGPWRDA